MAGCRTQKANGATRSARHSFASDCTKLTSQARIKKIMQMDEEVGKLASATPVMICKLPDRRWS